MSKISFFCAIVLLACLNWTSALPVKDQDVEDLMYKLQQLKQLNDASQITQLNQKNRYGEKEVSSPKSKRSLNNSDRRTLLYNYYARGLAPMYDKRNFDEIDRYSKFSGKRNMDFMDQYDKVSQVNKRNFDEIDRWAGFNSRLNHDRNMVDYVKRNFDEIDRYGKFNKRPFREVEDLGGSVKQTGSLGDEMAVINEYSQ
uniref:Putative orcokinin peptides type b-like protein n=1 Tax=Culex tarsalis TaxID=7177 RepID=A0A1Q3FZS2_CULTA